MAGEGCTISPEHHPQQIVPRDCSGLRFAPLSAARELNRWVAGRYITFVVYGQIQSGVIMEEQMDEALDAIHDVALKLLQHDLTNEVKDGIELILSIARHKHDVRSADEMGED